jgi:hypothetical protein
MGCLPAGGGGAGAGMVSGGMATIAGFRPEILLNSLKDSEFF